MGRGEAPERVGGILADILKRSLSARGGAEPAPPLPSRRPRTCEGTEVSDTGRYDFDLAEFPLFKFCKLSGTRRDRDPLVYADTITGKDGQPVPREWRAYPGPFGFGGASTHSLLYDLLQLYAEQGACGTQIQFGTLRSLFLRRGVRNPSKRDYDRLRRDIDILRGYDFHCRNAFWDRDRRAYVDMKWRLFGSVFYFKETPADDRCRMPFGFIEVSPVLSGIARSRGFFSIGFGHKLFHSLKPLEQRLAVYLAKKFIFQQTHRKPVDELARALPVEAARPVDIRVAVRKAVEGLLEKQIPFLAAFRFDRGRQGRYIAVFERKHAPRQGRRSNRFTAEVLEPSAALHLDLIAQAVGSSDDAVWWTYCIRRLGCGAVDRALGQ
ncbi:MAG: hypothetical protein ACRDD1_11495, partial [Planctomycetia bacterium]